MSTLPPLLPEETLRRVLRLASFDGMSILGCAGFFALLSAAGHDVQGAAIGLIVAGAGAVELHGVAVLQGGDSRGMRWLIGAQLLGIVTIVGYLGWRYGHPDPLFIEAFRATLREEQRETIRMSGLTEEQFILTLIRMACIVAGAVSLVYQGGLALYYSHRVAAVERALENTAVDEEAS